MTGLTQARIQRRLCNCEPRAFRNIDGISSLSMLIENLGREYVEALKANGAKMGQGAG